MPGAVGLDEAGRVFGPVRGPASGDAEADTLADTAPDGVSGRVVAGQVLARSDRTDSSPDTGADARTDIGADIVSAGRGPGGGAVSGAVSVRVLPSWLSSWEALSGAVRQAVSFRVRWTAFHVLRLPWYWLRLAAGAPRGVWRVVRWCWDWGTDVNGRTVRRAVAYGSTVGAMEATAFHRVSEQHRERMQFRLLALAVVFLGLSLGGAFAWVSLTGWQLGAGVAGVLAGLGALGRGQDSAPITSSFAVADSEAPRLTTDLIVLALGALGLAELNKAIRLGADPVRFLAPGVHRDGPGWRADIDLPAGVTAGDITERRDKLASGLKRPLSCVWPEPDGDAHEGRVILWVGDKPMAKAKPKPWPLADKGRVCLFDPFPIGLDQRGRPVTVTLMFASMITGAVPRMGKTFTMRLITLAAALDVTAELHVYDLKGGADWRPLEAVAHRYCSGDDEDDISALVADIRSMRADMSRRYKTVRGLPETICPEGKVTRELAADARYGLHPVVLVVDECQHLFEHPTFGKEAVEIVTDLVKRGPAVGIIVTLATQRVDAKSIPTGISSNAVLRMCLKVTGQLENDMVLGTSMYKAGVRATMFARSDKGVGYLVGEGENPVIVQTTYLDAPTAKKIALRARALRQAAGTLTGHAAGLDKPEAEQKAPTILDDLAAVMPAGEDKAWSEHLLVRLAELRPDSYGTWTATDLGNALAAYGIETVQIGKRDGGKVVNRKGLTRTSLAAALDRQDQRAEQRTEQPPSAPDSAGESVTEGDERLAG